MRRWKWLGWFCLLVILMTVILGFWQRRNEEIRREEERKNEVILTVAVGADVHNDLETLEKFTQAEADFLILAGDLTNAGGRKEMEGVKKVLEVSGRENYAVPGNHDWWNQKVNAGGWEEIFGRKYQSFTKKGIKFILIDNGYWKGLGEEQWNWLVGETAECIKVRCVAVAHMPLRHLVSGHVMGEDSRVVAEEAVKLEELLIKNRVEVLWSGHLHYSDDYEIGGLRTMLVGALTRARARVVEYSLMKIKGEGIERETVKIEL